MLSDAGILLISWHTEGGERRRQIGSDVVDKPIDLAVDAQQCLSMFDEMAWYSRTLVGNVLAVAVPMISVAS
jgi:hypothetical protein